nr:Immunoglobulin A1 protease [Ipomoea batatas]
MSAVVCGKRSSIFEDLQSSSSSELPASAPVSKRIRCSTFCPPRSAAAPSLFPVASVTSISSPLDYLIARYPGMDKQLLERALQECGDDLDSAIKSLNELHLGSGENLGLAAGKPDHTLVASTEILAQGTITNDGDATPPMMGPFAAKQPPMDSAEWVELFVREMMSASNIEDAKARASRALEILEKSIFAFAREAAPHSLQQLIELMGIELKKWRVCSLLTFVWFSEMQENLVLKQRLEALLQENNILKRAVSIQHERQKEFEERGQELNHMKQLVAQYQEQLRTLEVKSNPFSKLFLVLMFTVLSGTILMLYIVRTLFSSSAVINPSVSPSNTSKASLKFLSPSSPSLSVLSTPNKELQSSQNSWRSINPSLFSSTFSIISAMSLSSMEIPIFLSESLSSCFVINPSPFLSNVAKTPFNSSLSVTVALVPTLVVVSTGGVAFTG